MKQLELKDLKHYLGTGLKWTLQGLKTFTMSGLSEETLYTEEGSVLTWPKHPDLPQSLFPCFLPLSALTEPLADGSIPIVELAKMAYPKNGKDAIIEDGECYVAPKHDYIFGFDSVNNSFYCNWYDNTDCFIPNQLALFEYLYANHFWLGDQSLFETCEIIDKRTLK